MQRITLLPVLFSFLFCGCVPTLLSHNPSVKTNSMSENERILAQARKLYGDGVVHNMRGQWGEARDAFDSALQLLSQLSAEEDIEVIKEVDALLREIAYDYKFTLSHSDTLTVESAPVVISFALSDKPFSEVTQKRIKQLVDQLPDAGTTPHDFPIRYNERVKEKIVFFQTDARKPFTLWLARSRRYLPMIFDIFREENIPLDLAYLPLIESGFNPNAYSWAHAVGMWQFIKGTAKIYGLDVSWWIDERRDPEKSTRSAARYLKKLYNDFGDWEIALAAYNLGEGKMRRALDKQNKQSFWELNLPSQTENYVPLFIAALLIAKNPEKYGFTVADTFPPYKYDVVYVHEMVNLRLAAQCTDTTYEAISELNPELVRGCTPPGPEKYPLKVPPGKGQLFVERYRQIPDSAKVAWQRHKIEKGETLHRIARKYNTSVKCLVDANNIKDSRKLVPGTFILIPFDPNAQRSASQQEQNSRTTSTTTHIVKQGETLSKIAQKYGLTTSQLARMNGISANSIIRVGQKLKISENTPLPSSNQKVAQKPQEQQLHVVKKGETLWSIAQKYDVTVSQIKNWNNLKNDILSPGQTLTIKTSSNTESEPQQIFHTVKKGETLWIIAQKYGTDTDTIMKTNNITNPSKIFPGDKLKIVINKY